MSARKVRGGGLEGGIDPSALVSTADLKAMASQITTIQQRTVKLP